MRIFALALSGCLLCLTIFDSCARSQEFRKIWEFPAKRTCARPTVANGRVYFGSVDGTFYCLDANSGAESWSFAAEREVVCRAVVVGEYVFFAAGSVYCLDKATGQERWSFSATDVIRAEILVTSGRVFFACQDGSVYCLDSATGTQVWTASVGSLVETGITHFENLVFFGTVEGWLHCVTMEDGKPIWKFDTGQRVYRPPRFSHDRLYGGHNDATWCLDPISGKEIWPNSFEFGGNPVVDRKFLYVKSFNDSTLSKLDAASGNELWRSSLPAAPSNIAVTNGKVYVSDHGGHLTCVAAESGEVLWRFDSETHRWITEITIVDGRAYFGSKNKVIAVDIGDSQANWPPSPGWQHPSGMKWTYSISASDEDVPPLVLELDRYEKVDGVLCAIFKLWDGSRLALSCRQDGIRVQDSSYDLSSDDPLAIEIDGWLKALTADERSLRDQATSKLASIWYIGRKNIDTHIEASENPEVKLRGDLIRRLASENLPPLFVQYPLEQGKKWTNYKGETCEVLNAEPVDVGDETFSTWKIRFGTETIWWSDIQHIPIMIQIGRSKWILDRQVRQVK